MPRSSPVLVALAAQLPPAPAACCRRRRRNQQQGGQRVAPPHRRRDLPTARGRRGAGARRAASGQPATCALPTHLVAPTAAAKRRRAATARLVKALQWHGPLAWRPGSPSCATGTRALAAAADQPQRAAARQSRPLPLGPRRAAAARLRRAAAAAAMLSPSPARTLGSTIPFNLQPTRDHLHSSTVSRASWSGRGARGKTSHVC